jgi:hypothetical protein
LVAAWPKVRLAAPFGLVVIGAPDRLVRAAHAVTFLRHLDLDPEGVLGAEIVVAVDAGVRMALADRRRPRDRFADNFRRPRLARTQTHTRVMATLRRHLLNPRNSALKRQAPSPGQRHRVPEPSACRPPAGQHRTP